jgi:hypothetical protein
MRVELEHIRGPRARWGFSLGCARAAAAMRMRAALREPERGGALPRAAMVAASGAVVGLAAYGLVRYPALRAEASTWASLAYLVALLLAYVAGALTLARGTTRQAVATRRYGSAGGLAVGAAWLLVLEPTEIAKPLVVVPLAAALFIPAGVAALAGHSTRSSRAATEAALWAGLVGGLTVFIVWATATYVRDGGPYDPQLLRDFHASGAHDLATYAVSDNLGAGLALLTMVPIVALAFGSLVGRIAAVRQPRRRTPRSAPP